MRWVTDLVSSARVEVQFRRRDRDARRAELESAVQAYPTEQLEAELAIARERLAAELELRFDAPMRANRASLAAFRRTEASLIDDHVVLSRNYGEELKGAYEELDRLKSKRKLAQEAVREASADLKDAKSRVSAWHRRSKSSLPIYGKRGKHIPRHSFFFFSHSDLDSAKRDADRAASRIGEAMRDRDTACAEVKRCGESIGELKESRDRRRVLLDAGRTRSKILSDIAALQPEINRLSGAEGRMQSLRMWYVASGNAAVVVQDLEQRIRSALEQRAARLKAFDDRAARELRRVAFRDTVREP